MCKFHCAFFTRIHDVFRALLSTQGSDSTEYSRYLADKWWIAKGQQGVTLFLWIPSIFSDTVVAELQKDPINTEVTVLCLTIRRRCRLFVHCWAVCFHHENFPSMCTPGQPILTANLIQNWGVFTGERMRTGNMYPAYQHTNYLYGSTCRYDV